MLQRNIRKELAAEEYKTILADLLFTWSQAPAWTAPKGATQGCSEHCRATSLLFFILTEGSHLVLILPLRERHCITRCWPIFPCSWLQALTRNATPSLQFLTLLQSTAQTHRIDTKELPTHGCLFIPLNSIQNLTRGKF